MGERIVGLSERLREPGNAGCSGAQPPENIGVRLVYDLVPKHAFFGASGSVFRSGYGSREPPE